MTATPGRVYGALACAFAAFAIWGSWFPFTIEPARIAVAAPRLWTAAGFDVNHLSLTDAASNLLLFVPIGLFTAAARGRRSHQPGGAAAIVAFGALLSITVELGQAAIPWRTPSIFDIAAETTGTFVGLGIWLVCSIEMDHAFSAIVLAWRQAAIGRRLSWLYAGAFAVAWLLPLDFTIRPDEIGDKYFHQRLLLPLSASPDAASPAQLLFTAVAAVPLGIAAMTCGMPAGARRSLPAACFLAGAYAFALTLLQVTVFSRTTDTTSMMAALIGLAAGAAIATRVIDAGEIRQLSTGIVRGLLLAALWIAAAAAVESWPYRFDTDVWHARREMAAWSGAPFRASLNAGNVIAGAVLAAAAAIVVKRHLHAAYARLQMGAAVATVAIIFATFESVRLLLPAAMPTLMSPLLKTLVFLLVLVVTPAAPPPSLSFNRG
jgi:hypothetical protein